jgi:hypothetical protein
MDRLNVGLIAMGGFIFHKNQWHIPMDEAALLVLRTRSWR